MPTYDDPIADATELSEAARGLAHASRGFPEPIDSYRVLGNLQSALMSLHQSIQQISEFHLRNADRASTDNGDRATGREHALMAAVRLEAAATHVDRATDQLMAGFVENGCIAWQPASAAVEALADRQAALDPTSPDANEPGGSRRSPIVPPDVGR